MARSQAKDHEVKRKTILSTAAEVFASRGIVSASMNEVATACSISKANIYHYYPSKYDLVFDILDAYLETLRDRICSLDLNQPPAQPLHLLTKEILLLYEGMDNEHKIQTEGLALLSVQQQTVLKNYQREMVAVMCEAVRASAPDTFDQQSAKCKQVAMSVFGMLNWFYMWQPKATKSQRIDYAATVAELTLHGVGGLSVQADNA